MKFTATEREEKIPDSLWLFPLAPASPYFLCCIYYTTHVKIQVTKGNPAVIGNIHAINGLHIFSNV